MLKKFSKSEEGATLIELVIAIPIMLIMFSTILTGFGLAQKLSNDITLGAGTTREIKEVAEKLQDMRNCYEIQDAANTMNSNVTPNKPYNVRIDPISCTDVTTYTQKTVTIKLVSKENASKILNQSSISILVR